MTEFLPSITDHLPFSFSDVLSFCVSLLAFVIGYVLLGLGLSRLARSVAADLPFPTASPRPWLAWIPFGRMYLLGHLADIYTDNRMTADQNRADPLHTPSNLRGRILRNSIGCFILGNIWNVGLGVIMILFFFLLMGAGYAGNDLPADTSSIVSLYPLIVPLLLAVGGIYVFLAVRYLIAYCPALCRVLTALGSPTPQPLTAASVFFPIVGAFLIYRYTRDTQSLSSKFSPAQEEDPPEC